MSTTAPRLPSARFAAWRPTRFELLAIAGAFLLGMVLFLVATRGQRGDAPAVSPTAVARPSAFDPLPAPMPADAAGASGMAQAGEEPPLEERPRLVEAPRPAPTPAAPPLPTIRAPVADVSAVPISSPAPAYPRRAMQRRQTGTVRVQVDVGPDGRPDQVRVLESSDSRDLDRAALDAVRRWRFSPAMREGQPVPATVVVPIAFRL